MKKWIFLLAIVAFASACEPPVKGNGNIVKSDRDLSGFDEIDVSGNFEVHLMEANDFKVTVQADDNLQDFIETYVKGDRLYIKSDKHLSSDDLKIFVSMKELHELDLSGASEVHMKNEFNTEELSIEVSGAAQLDLNLRVAKLEVDASGACEMHAKGIAEEMRIDASGACEVMATDLKVSKCHIQMSGAGEANVWAVQELHVQVSGAGEVNYKGNPERITQDISGAASVTSLK